MFPEIMPPPVVVYPLFTAAVMLAGVDGGSKEMDSNRDESLPRLQDETRKVEIKFEQRLAND